ncbi:RNA polymerase sigma-70 factor [Sphingobacterium thalpophilum]|uniref:RNA polymerase sigma-70 factor n=1 Tax=Sphingobacterium thalpophilum TaxID=259 RepID=UPI0037DA19C4
MDSCQSYDDFSDLALVDLLVERDDIAFAVIYERYWGMLFAHAFKMLQEEQASKDVVQDVFINLWNVPADQLTLISSLKNYLFVATRNRILNLIRNQKVRRDYIGLFSLYIDEHADTTIELLEEKELMQQLDEVISTFPPRMKEIFQLSREHFRSHREIAQQLGISEATVSRQISNALSILRSKLPLNEGHIIALLYLQQFLKK